MANLQNNWRNMGGGRWQNVNNPQQTIHDTMNPGLQGHGGVAAPGAPQGNIPAPRQPNLGLNNQPAQGHPLNSYNGNSQGQNPFGINGSGSGIQGIDPGFNGNGLQFNSNSMSNSMPGYTAGQGLASSVGSGFGGMFGNGQNQSQMGQSGPNPSMQTYAVNPNAMNASSVFGALGGQQPQMGSNAQPQGTYAPQMNSQVGYGPTPTMQNYGNGNYQG